MAYDSAGRMVGYGPPAAGLPTSGTSYGYNTAKQVTAIHRPDGITVGFGYDTAGRPSAVSFDRGTIGFSYSATTGNLTSLTAPGGNTLGFTYDGSLPTSVTWSGAISGSTAVTYNTNFQVTGQTVNGGNAVSYGYDLDGLLTQAGGLGLRRDAQNGRLIADSVGGTKTEYFYNSHGEPYGLVTTRGPDTLMITGYERDSLSRITRLVERIEGVTHEALFGYDTVGRLKTVIGDGALSASYSYDQNGNRLSRASQGPVARGVYDDQDRMTSYATGAYSYGPNGELRTKVVGSDTTKYTYDALGNLTRVLLPDGIDIEYVIDAQNRRVGKKVNGILVAGWLYQGQLSPVAELDAAGNVRSRFVYATRSNVPDYMIRGDTTYRLISDHLGSVRLAVNVATGAIAQRISYDEFGVESVNSNPDFQPFGFAGGMTDRQSGLERFGVRDYDPAIGRWTTKDPILFAGGETNLYLYSGGDPVNSIDANGQSVRSAIASFALGLTVSAVAGYATAFLAGVAATAASPVIAAAAAVAVAGIAIAGIVSTVMVVADVVRQYMCDGALNEASVDKFAGLAGGIVGGVAGFRAGSPGGAPRSSTLTNEQIVNAVAETGAKVEIGPTAKGRGEGVVMRFPNGEHANIRVETHPIEPGGLPVRHGDVWGWRADRSVFYQRSHITE